jgi:hypothetical protein
MANERRSEIGRRGFLAAAGSLAALSLVRGTNAHAMAVQLTMPELAELNASVSAIEIQGARLPDGVLQMSGVEAPAKS